MTDIDKWRDWQTDISKAKLNGTLQPETTFDWRTGGASIHSILHTVEENRRIGWTGDSLGTRAIHNWTLDEVNGSTQVFVEESMEGLLMRLFKGAFNKNLEKGMMNWLVLLKTECEK
jgi:hypothetical protein